jgi:hypothetical protein
VKYREGEVAETLGNLLHDINDALGVAVGNLELALEACDSGRCDPQCLEEALRGCVEAADHIVRLRRELHDRPGVVSKQKPHYE